MESISSVTDTVDQIVVNRWIIITEFENEGYTVTRLSVDIMSHSFHNFSTVDYGISRIFCISTELLSFSIEQV